MTSFKTRNTGDLVFPGASELGEALPPTASMQPYLSLAQPHLTNKLQEDIRKPIIAILIPNSACENTGDLSCMSHICRNFQLMTLLVYQSSRGNFIFPFENN